MSTKKLCIDLCAGRGGFSASFKNDNAWEVVTVELDKKFKPTICADVTHLPLKENLQPDCLLAGPPCEITVEKVGSKYHLYAEKKYGDGLGVAGGFDSAQQVLAEIRRYTKLWQGFDLIVNRIPDPLTEANTAFTSNTSEVTAAMMFHPEQRTLLEVLG